MTSGIRGARGPRLFGYQMPVRPRWLVSARSLTIGPISLPYAKATGQAPVDMRQRPPGLDAHSFFCARDHAWGLTQADAAGCFARNNNDGET